MTMKKLLIFALAAVAMCMPSCDNDDTYRKTWEEYAKWRDANNQWLAQQAARTNDDGTPYFTKIIPDWSPGSYVLIHYFNDRTETESNLSPIYTSTVDTKYILHLYDGTPADSSVLCTTPAKGVFRTRLNEVISGWAIALTQMHCGDTAEVIVPYGAGYGNQDLGAIPPFSNLRFNIRLVDIPFYETSPYVN